MRSCRWKSLQRLGLKIADVYRLKGSKKGVGLPRFTVISVNLSQGPYILMRAPAFQRSYAQLAPTCKNLLATPCVGRQNMFICPRIRNLIFASVHFQGRHKSVFQVDFVPTLSLLLGVPIPFSNLGSIITDLFTYCPWWKTDSNKIQQVRIWLWCT